MRANPTCSRREATPRTELRAHGLDSRFLAGRTEGTARRLSIAAATSRPPAPLSRRRCGPSRSPPRSPVWIARGHSPLTRSNWSRSTPRNSSVRGLRASIVAEATYSSIPRPGAQLATSSRLSGFTETHISRNPASFSQASIADDGAAPATQPQTSARSAASSGVSSRRLITSEIASLPPGLRTRIASRNTCALSGTRLITQFDRMTSAVLSAIGRCSSSPRRNSTFPAPTPAAFSRALLSISCVMSTPMTPPSGPTCLAASRQSNPAPLPRSTTVSPGRIAAIACGLPQPRPRLAPSGTAANSSAE